MELKDQKILLVTLVFVNAFCWVPITLIGLIMSAAKMLNTVQGSIMFLVSLLGMLCMFYAMYTSIKFPNVSKTRIANFIVGFVLVCIPAFFGLQHELYILSLVSLAVSGLIVSRQYFERT